MILRNYQNEAVAQIFEKWQSHRSTLLVLYTGGGKTIIFADVIRKIQPKRALVLAHREELIFQARDKIERTTGLQCEIEMADIFARDNLFHRTPVVISTVQTQVSGNGRKRMHRFDPMDFGLLIIDEAHHATAGTYRQVIDHYKQNPDLKVLGVTATPDRSDQQALGQIFESVAGRYEILDGIEDGWLCDITQMFIPVAGLDYSHVRTTAGDLNGADLKAVMERESNIMGICQPSLEVLFGLEPHTLDDVKVPEWGQFLGNLGKQARRAIVFTASVAQAEACCNIFNRVHDKLAHWVCGATPKDDRREILKSFASGVTRVVVNCGVLTEGFDDPGVEVIIMARPTKSRSLYAQMVGRATRTVPGLVDNPELDTPEKRRAAIAASEKQYCRIIDFVGNSGKHSLVTCMDILGGKVSDAVKKKAVAAAHEKPVRVMRELSKAEVQIEEEKKRRAEERRRQEEARKASLVAKSRYTTHNVDPFGSSHGPMVNNGWKRHGKSFSEKQRNFIRRFFGKNPDTISYAEGVRLIAAKIASWAKQKG